MPHRRNGLTGRQTRTRLRIAVVSFTLGALLMLPIVLGR